MTDPFADPDRILGPLQDRLSALVKVEAEEPAFEAASPVGQVSIAVSDGQVTNLTISAKAMRQTNADLAARLIEVLNELLASMRQRRGDSARARLLDLAKLADYTRADTHRQLERSRAGLREATRFLEDVVYRPRP